MKKKKSAHAAPRTSNNVHCLTHSTKNVSPLGGLRSRPPEHFQPPPVYKMGDFKTQEIFDYSHCDVDVNIFLKYLWFPRPLAPRWQIGTNCTFHREIFIYFLPMSILRELNLASSHIRGGGIFRSRIERDIFGTTTDIKNCMFPFTWTDENFHPLIKVICNQHKEK